MQFTSHTFFAPTLSKCEVCADEPCCEGARSMSDNRWLSDENVFGLISDNCPDLIALIDVNGFFVYSNTAHFIRLGRSVESLVGATVYELIHPVDVASFQKTITASTRRRTLFNVSARWLR